MKRPIEIFFSYAHEDETLMDEVRRQLIGYDRRKIIHKWHDRLIAPGSEWNGQIDERLHNSDIVLLFISPHFIESDYCYDAEMTEAMRRHETGEARVIPVILRPCLWQEEPFGKLQALPLGGKALTAWANRDEGAVNVAEGVMSVVWELIAKDSLPKGRNDSKLLSSDQSIDFTRDSKAAGVVSTAIGSQEIELNIDEDFDRFTPEKREAILRAIGEFLKVDYDIVVKRMRRGSVILTIGLLPEDAERLKWAVQRGEFDALRVKNAQLVFSSDEDSKLGGVIETEGTIVSILAGTMFQVELANHRTVLAHISGKMRERFIRLTNGDRVKLEMSPYDLDKARITYRLE
jgi:translation initiation factor IF-1